MQTAACSPGPASKPGSSLIQQATGNPPTRHFHKSNEGRVQIASSKGWAFEEEVAEA